MSKYRWVMLPLALAGVFLLGRAFTVNGATAGTAAQPNDQLNAVINKVMKACFSIRSAKGEVVVHSWRKERGAIFETECKYKVAVVGLGQKYRCESSRLGVKNELGPGAWNAHTAKLAAATKSITFFSFDGQKYTRYFVQQNLAQIESNDKSTLRFNFPYVMETAGLYVNTPHNSKLPNGDDVEFTASILKNESVNGSNCLVLESAQIGNGPGKTPSGTVSIQWIDTNKGYAVAKVQVYGVVSGFRQLSQEMNTDLKDYGDGVWGPSKCIIKEYETGKDGKPELIFKNVVTYGPNFKINVKLSSDDLTIKLPKGTRVENKISGKVYTAQ